MHQKNDSSADAFKNLPSMKSKKPKNIFLGHLNNILRYKYNNNNKYNKYSKYKTLSKINLSLCGS